MKRQSSHFHDITEAQYVSGYRIRLEFNDDTSRIMDFEPILRKASNPDVIQYHELKTYKQFRIQYGDLMRGGYEMISPITDRYRGEI